MRTKQTMQPGPLAESVVRVCLRGWGASGSEPLSGADSSALFDLFQGNTAAVAEMWRTHEAFLESEARRLGITPRRRWWEGV